MRSLQFVGLLFSALLASGQGTNWFQVQDYFTAIHYSPVSLSNEVSCVEFVLITNLTTGYRIFKYTNDGTNTCAEHYTNVITQVWEHEWAGLTNGTQVSSSLNSSSTR